MSAQHQLATEVTREITGVERKTAENIVNAVVIASASKEAVSSTIEVVEEFRSSSWWRIAGYVAIGVYAWMKS